MVTADFELGVGQMVGEYRVLRKIGEGAFGKVYAAVHPVIGKPAAIKVLNQALASNQEMVARFADEARAVNQIRHRHIIDIFSFGTLPNGQHYFVMELLEGLTFQAYLRQHGPLDPAQAFAILWPVGRALSAAHKAGIAHRDLKPENIFLIVDQDGGIFPKLLDFGIAKLMSDSEMAHRTRTGMLLGTPVYMSPEQCRATQVDHRADIYAFGIMTHEALTGRRPFDAENVMDVIMKQISDPPPRMSACRAGLPPALDAPVLQMLEKSPAKRPQSMQAALDALAEAARSSGIAAPVSLPQGAGPAAAPAGASPTPSAAGMGTDAWLRQQQGIPSSHPATASGAVAAASMTGPAMSGAVPSLVLGPPSAGGAAPASFAQATPGAGSPMSSYSGPASHPSMAGPQAPSASYAGPGSHSPSASYAGPGSHSPSASYAGQGPYPAAGHGQGDTATLLSAGSGARLSSPSFPGAAPASMAGFAPHSAHAPAAPPKKSNLPVILGAAGGGLFLLLAGGLVLASLGGDPPPTGSTEPPAGSTAPPAGTAPPAAGGTIQIGTEVPQVGRAFEQETDGSFRIEIKVPGKPQPARVGSRERCAYKTTILAVNDWHTTRAEVQYLDCDETLSENGAPGKKKVKPTARKTFFVSDQPGGPSVASLDGKQVTAAEKEDVLNKVRELFEARTEIFRRPLAPGDSLSPPPALAAKLLGLTSTDPTIEARVEAPSLRLRSIDRARKTALFDVKVTYFHDDKGNRVAFSSPLEGTVTFDIPTGIPIAAKLSGPVRGETVQSGVKMAIEGSIEFVVKAGAGR